MKTIKVGMILLVAMALLVVVMVQAQTNKELQPKEVKQKVDSIQPKDTDTLKPVSIPERSVFEDPRQGYKMVTDVLDAFGGQSQSTNYKIPVNSGGQSSTTGISQSDHYVMKTGYVHASSVMRGDANTDGLINSADVAYLINYLFIGGPPPCPLEAGDSNCDWKINSADVAYLINYLFIGGPSPCG